VNAQPSIELHAAGAHAFVQTTRAIFEAGSRRPWGRPRCMQKRACEHTSRLPE